MAPSMNENMYLHFSTQKNLAFIQAQGVHIIEPEEGFLACRTQGKGRMAEPERLFEESFSIADANEVWILEMVGKGKQMLDKKGNVDVKNWTKSPVWVARRIPDGYVSGHANQARITTFPLENGKTSISTKNI